VCVLESRGGFSQPHLRVKRLFVAHFVVHFIELTLWQFASHVRQPW